MKTIENKYPGIIINKEWEDEVIVEQLIDPLVDGRVVALRIADQPPYGFVFRVDIIDLVERIWKSKGRITGEGKVDLTKKPVTSLSSVQLSKFVDWVTLDTYGFSRSQVNQLLESETHVVLPVNDGLPKHLVTQSSNGCSTISTFCFPEDTMMGMLIERVSEINGNAILGGTSINIINEPAIVDTAVLLETSKTLGLDYLVLSETEPQSNGEGLFHPMIALMDNSTIMVLRNGIGFESLTEQVLASGMRIIHKEHE